MRTLPNWHPEMSMRKVCDYILMTFIWHHFVYEIKRIRPFYYSPIVE